MVIADSKLLNKFSNSLGAYQKRVGKKRCVVACVAGGCFAVFFVVVCLFGFLCDA